MQIKKLYKTTAEMTFDLEFSQPKFEKNLMFLTDFDCGNVLDVLTDQAGSSQYRYQVII